MTRYVFRSTVGMVLVSTSHYPSAWVAKNFRHPQSRCEVEMETTPRIARHEWNRHPNYPSQVLLLGSHENFRSVNQWLIDRAMAGHPKPPLLELFQRWIGGMRSHEAYEEIKRYPYLARRFGVDFGSSKQGHEALHDAYDEVITAFDADGDDRLRLIGALANHQTILKAHLELEEDAVIPLLLELEPSEFHHYSHSSIQTLLAEFDRASG